MVRTSGGLAWHLVAHGKFIGSGAILSAMASVRVVRGCVWRYAVALSNCAQPAVWSAMSFRFGGIDCSLVVVIIIGKASRSSASSVASRGRVQILSVTKVRD